MVGILCKVFSQTTFCEGAHAGLSAAVVLFAAAVVLVAASDVGDPLSGKHKLCMFLFSTSCVAVGCVKVGGRACTSEISSLLSVDGRMSSWLLVLVCALPGSNTMFSSG
jgi:hypothetical protein